MKGIWLAAILASTTAIAVPVFAQSAGSDTQQTQAATPAQQGDEQDGTGDAMHGPGRWGMHGWMGRHDMWRRAMMGGDPQQWCIDRLARRAARRAYIETKLDLTAEQRPLWDKLQTIAQGETQKERALCQQLKPGQQTTILDRVSRAQEFLSARLDALQSAKPALQALYQALTPDQRAIMDRPFGRQ
ncbi:MAG TPA: Spy/CpxP family protein refolding chaperone [Stellaceae bacterium]|nr:Spy/CpxP family protein refolding chaperone [Stellaceae bacterium]